MSDALFELAVPVPPPHEDVPPSSLWLDARPRLAALATRPGAADVFGAIGHRWELEPPLTVTELAELESQVGLSLPADYRAFLLQAGRGGAGPAYGLFPLRRDPDRWRWVGDGASDGDREPLIKPFAHIRAFTPTAGDENPAHSYRLLYLCHQGCALREALVVSGPSRGQMWADYTAEGDGFHPMQNPDGARMTFTDWYRTWLTRAERNAAVAPADSPL